MKHLISKIIFICILSGCLHIQAAFAQEHLNKANKESFKAKWEEHIASLPETELFEPTDTPNIYNLRTSLFDFDGQIELLNIVISDQIEYYYNYELKEDANIIGVAETKFLGVEDDFFKDRYHSHNIWSKNQFLFFLEGTNDWNSETEWLKFQNSDMAATTSKPPKSNRICSKDILSDYFLPTFLAILIIFIAITKRSQDRQTKKYDLSMARQKQAVEWQEDGLKIAEESLELQREQNKLLQHILDQKK